MIHLLGKIAAMPLKVLWLIMSLIPGVQLPEWLLYWIWRLDGGETETLRYLTLISQLRGYEGASQLAASLLENNPLCSVAAYTGLIAMSYGQLEEASTWLKKAQACEQGSPELVLQLELALANQRDDQSNVDIATKIMTRKDVSMTLTRSALTILTLSALAKQQWHTAMEILDRVFHIEDPTHLRWMRWVAAEGLQEDSLAQTFYEAALKDVPPEEALFNQAYGWFLLNDRDQGKSAVVEALEAGAPRDRIRALCQQFGLEINIDDSGSEEAD